MFTRWDVQQAYIDKLNACGLAVKNVIIWDKISHSMGDLRRAFGSRYESIIWAVAQDYRFPGKRPTDIIRCSRVAAQKLSHPNEKPVSLLETLIRKTTKQNELVLDFCMGSGTTGVACVKTGRSFIGIELDESYFQIAEKRIREAETNAAKRPETA